MPSLFEHAGGEQALHRLEETFYASVLRDPLLQPLFGAGRPEHVDHLTAFTAESFGGPGRFSRELGFAHLIAVHRGLRISEPQRARFVELYMEALDAADMPADPAFRDAVREHVRVRLASRDAELARGVRRRAAPAARGATLDLGGGRLKDADAWMRGASSKAALATSAHRYSGARPTRLLLCARCDPYAARAASGRVIARFAEMTTTTAAVALDPDEVAERLRRPMRAIPEVHREPAAGGLPEQHGVYAWWVSPGGIPGVKGPAHPTEQFELLYVGIAPKDGKSKATLRSRIRGQHLGGNIGSSTFRQSLAALLFEDEGWVTRRSGTRSQLIPEHNRALSEWQRDHLRLAWVERPRPWENEARVIALMQPSLNLVDNASHPLYLRLKGLRAKLRASSPGDDRVRRPRASETTPPRTSPLPPVSRRDSVGTPHYRTQRVTAKDIEVGQVRIPRGATKTVLPSERREIAVRLRGQDLTCRWDPRYGPPERSGVIRVGRAAAADLLHPDDVLAVRVRARRVELD